MYCSAYYVWTIKFISFSHYTAFHFIPFYICLFSVTKTLTTFAAFFCCCFLLLALSSNLRIWTIIKLMCFVCKMFKKREFDLLKRIIVIGNYVCCGSNKSHWNNRKYLCLHCVCVQCTLYVCVIHKYTHTFFIIGWHRNLILIGFSRVLLDTWRHIATEYKQKQNFVNKFITDMRRIVLLLWSFFFKEKCQVSTEAFIKCHFS